MDELIFDDSVRRSLRREDGAVRCWALARKLVSGLSLAVICKAALAQAMHRN